MQLKYHTDHHSLGMVRIEEFEAAEYANFHQPAGNCLWYPWYNTYTPPCIFRGWCNADSIRERTSHKATVHRSQQNCMTTTLWAPEKKQPEDLQTMVGIYICTIWVHISPTSNSQSDTPHCTDVNISAFWSRWSDDRGGTSHNITVLMLR